MTGPAAIQQDDAAVTIRTPAMLAATYRAVLLGIRQRRHDGLPAADLQQLARALYRAHTAAMASSRQLLATATPGPPHSNSQDAGAWCSTGEAATLLGLSRRTVQRMAADSWGSDAIRVGQTWVLRRAPLLALAAQRKATK